jgi:hypothetical protein
MSRREPRVRQPNTTSGAERDKVGPGGGRGVDGTKRTLEGAARVSERLAGHTAGRSAASASQRAERASQRAGLAQQFLTLTLGMITVGLAEAAGLEAVAMVMSIVVDVVPQVLGVGQAGESLGPISGAAAQRRRGVFPPSVKVCP